MCNANICSTKIGVRAAMVRARKIAKQRDSNKGKTMDDEGGDARKCATPTSVYDGSVQGLQ